MAKRFHRSDISTGLQRTGRYLIGIDRKKVRARKKNRNNIRKVWGLEISVRYIQENPSVYEWGGKIVFMVKREKMRKEKPREADWKRN